MTPTLRKDVQDSRPLFDPHPDNLVVKEAVTNPMLKRCRISDHVHMALICLLKVGDLEESDVLRFESPYCHHNFKTLKVRAIRQHLGHPARAPDGTIMTIMGEACPGDSNEPAGPWNESNVHLCGGYEAWLEAVKRTSTGVAPGQVNRPMPTRDDLYIMMAYIPQLTKNSGPGGRGGQGSGDRSGTGAIAPVQAVPTFWQKCAEEKRNAIAGSVSLEDPLHTTANEVIDHVTKNSLLYRAYIKEKFFDKSVQHLMFQTAFKKTQNILHSVPIDYDLSLESFNETSSILHKYDDDKAESAESYMDVDHLDTDNVLVKHAKEMGDFLQVELFRVMGFVARIYYYKGTRERTLEALESGLADIYTGDLVDQSENHE